MTTKLDVALVPVLHQTTRELCAYAEKDVETLTAQEISDWILQMKSILEREYSREEYEFATGIASSLWRFMGGLKEYRSRDWPESPSTSWPRQELRREGTTLLSKTVKKRSWKTLWGLLGG